MRVVLSPQKAHCHRQNYSFKLIFIDNLIRYITNESIRYNTEKFKKKYSIEEAFCKVVIATNYSTRNWGVLITIKIEDDSSYDNVDYQAVLTLDQKR